MFKLASILLYMYIYKSNSKATKDARNNTNTGTIQKYQKKNLFKTQPSRSEFLIIHHYLAFSAMSRHSKKIIITQPFLQCSVITQPFLQCSDIVKKNSSLHSLSCNVTTQSKIKQIRKDNFNQKIIIRRIEYIFHVYHIHVFPFFFFYLVSF